MTTIHTSKKFFTAAVGAVVASIAAPALLFLSAGSAQAFNPQPDPPGFPDPSSQVGFAEESEFGLAGPHVLPPLHH
jgi:hypothetical protein